IADLLRVAGRTLRQWCRDLLDRWKPVLPLGRPAARSPRATRETVIAFLDELGPGVGVPTLRPCFPAMRRAELADLGRRARRGWRRRRPAGALWFWAGRAPGGVGATASPGPPTWTDGRFPSLGPGRARAAGMQRGGQPVAAAPGGAGGGALAGLSAVPGPP